MLCYVQTRWDFCDIFICSKDIRNFRFLNYLTVHDCLKSNFLKITVLNVEILLDPNLLECVGYFLPMTSYCRNQFHFFNSVHNSARLFWAKNWLFRVQEDMQIISVCFSCRKLRFKAFLLYQFCKYWNNNNSAAGSLGEKRQKTNA